MLNQNTDLINQSYVAPDTTEVTRKITGKSLAFMSWMLFLALQLSGYFLTLSKLGNDSRLNSIFLGFTVFTVFVVIVIAALYLDFLAKASASFLRMEFYIFLLITLVVSFSNFLKLSFGISDMSVTYIYFPLPLVGWVVYPLDLFSFYVFLLLVLEAPLRVLVALYKKVFVDDPEARYPLYEANLDLIDKSSSLAKWGLKYLLPFFIVYGLITGFVVWLYSIALSVGLRVPTISWIPSLYLLFIIPLLLIELLLIYTVLPKEQEGFLRRLIPHFNHHRTTIGFFALISTQLAGIALIFSQNLLFGWFALIAWVNQYMFFTFAINNRTISEDKKSANEPNTIYFYSYLS